MDSTEMRGMIFFSLPSPYHGQSTLPNNPTTLARIGQGAWGLANLAMSYHLANVYEDAVVQRGRGHRTWSNWLDRNHARKDSERVYDNGWRHIGKAMESTDGTLEKQIAALPGEEAVEMHRLSRFSPDKNLPPVAEYRKRLIATYGSRLLLIFPTGRAKDAAEISQSVKLFRITKQ